MTTRYDPDARNVLGRELKSCSTKPMTGFFRNGCCETGAQDLGLHTVCAVMTAEFLAYSRIVGNDLSTPQPDLGFQGLRPGDRWCLCAPRAGREALDAGAAPQLVLEANPRGNPRHRPPAHPQRPRGEGLIWPYQIS